MLVTVMLCATTFIFIFRCYHQTNDSLGNWAFGFLVMSQAVPRHYESLPTAGLRAKFVGLFRGYTEL